MNIYTTVDIEKQRDAEEAVREGLYAFDRRHSMFEPQKTTDDADAQAIEEKIKKDLKINGLDPKATYRVVIKGVEKNTVHASLGGIDVVLDHGSKERLFHGKFVGKPLSDIFKKNQVWFVKLKSKPGVKPIVVKLPEGAQSALVSIDPKTRHVVAMVGSFDFRANKFDHATQMTRQTGSSYKPIVYAAAINAKVITPATLLLDSPAVFAEPNGKKWSPKNSDGKWRGPIRVREGLGGSRNVIAVRVLKEVGIGAAIDFAKKIGVKGKITEGYTMAMGSSELTPLEMANVYATFASGGIYAEPQFITHIHSTRGEVETFNNPTQQVISPDVAFLISSLMTSVVSGYTDSNGKRHRGTGYTVSKLGRPVAGKTGTTNDARDAWFIGFVPQLVTSVWTGYDDNHSLGRSEYGGKVSAPIWLNYMKKATKNLPPLDFHPPDSGIVDAFIDPQSGKLVHDPANGIKEWFLQGTEPTSFADSADTNSNSDFIMNQFDE